MTTVSIIHFLLFVIYVFFAGFILAKNTRALLNIAACVFFLLMSLWSISFAFVFNPYTELQTATFFVHLGSNLNLFVCHTILFAFLIITGQKKIYKSPYFYIFLFGIPLFYIFIEQSHALIAIIGRTNTRGWWLVKYQKNIWNTVFLSYYYLVEIFAFGLLIYHLIKTKNKVKKKQIKTILITGLTAFILGIINVNLANATNYAVINFSNVFILILAGGLLHNIIKYKTMVVSPATAAEIIIETMPDALVLADKYGKIITVNSALIELSGLNESYLIGKRITVLFTKRARKQREEFPLVKPSLKRNNLELNLLHKDKRKIPIHLSASYLSDDLGKNIGIVCVLRDISENKKAELQLRKVQESLEKRVQERTLEIENMNKRLQKKMIESQIVTKALRKAKQDAEKSDRLKSSFLANLSHEIRTPMNAILGCAELLNDKELPPKIMDEYLDIIKNSGNHLLQIIDDIIDISELELKQMKLHVVKCNIKDMILELLQHYQNHPKLKNNQRLEINVALSDKKCNAIIYSDCLRIKQVLKNLISNAIKFTDQGKIEVGCFLTNNNEIQFYVKDTGIGINKEMQAIIFERFRQSDNSYARKYSGIGLGLSLSKGLIDLLGGNIWLESKPGKGSTFFFTIPIMKEEQPV